jgi:hypothetical protein
VEFPCPAYSEYDVLMDLNSAHILETAENGIGKHIWPGTGTSLCSRLARMNDIWLWDIGQTIAGFNISPPISTRPDTWISTTINLLHVCYASTNMLANTDNHAQEHGSSYC